MPEIKLIVEQDKAVTGSLELILIHLTRMEETIMASLDEVKTALAGAVAALDEIAVDQASQAAEIQKLKDQIAAGSPVTQAQLDELATSAKALRDKAEAAAAAVPTP